MKIKPFSERFVAPQAREECQRCARPISLCVCAALPQIENQTEILIVQHPRERFHPLGTARLLETSLKRCLRFVSSPRFTAFHGEAPPTSGSEDSLRAVLKADAALLFPGEGSVPLDELPPHERPSQLVIVDGTWSHAWTLLRDLAPLRELRQVSLNPENPSIYRIRKEPRFECISTLEAAILALEVVEPEIHQTEALLDAFRLKIDRHIEARSSSPAHDLRTLTKRRPPEQRRLPRILKRPLKDFVLAYGESSFCPDTKKEELCFLGLLNLGTGESRFATFDALAKLPELLRLHTGISESEFPLGKFDPDEAKASFAELLDDSQILVSWSPLSNDAWSEWLPLPSQRVHLKSSYKALNRGGGSVEEVCAAESISPQPLSFPGRAASRLAHQRGLFLWLWNYANGTSESL